MPAPWSADQAPRPAPAVSWPAGRGQSFPGRAGGPWTADLVAKPELAELAELAELVAADLVAADLVAADLGAADLVAADQAECGRPRK